MNYIPSPSRLSPGDRLGNFTIRSLIGRGKKAEVYRAYHPDFETDIAIKCYQLDIEPHSAVAAQFEQEVRAIAGLRHPNIMRVYEAGLDGNRQYIVMEMIEGIALRDLLSTHPTGLDRDETMRIFVQIASATATAHDQSIVHGNIKPDNVLLDQNQRPILTNFAIPCLRPFERDLPGIATTPAYLAPEQVSDQRDTAQSDIYALGIVLYEMVTGDIPFSGDSYEQVVQQHLYADPTPPNQITVGMDPRVDFVILKALSKNPGDRFKSPRNMVDALENQELGDRFETLNLRGDEIDELHRRRSEIVRFKRSRMIEAEKRPTPVTSLKKIAPVLVVVGLFAAIILAVILVLMLL